MKPIKPIIKAAWEKLLNAASFVARHVRNGLAAVATALCMAILAVLLYLVYLPFGLFRLLCDYRLTKEFYADVKSTLHILHRRWYPNKAAS